MPNDYISREELLQDIEDTIKYSGCVNHESEIIDCVRYEPAADVAPVVHARWVEHIDDYENSCKCDICGFMPDSPLDETDYCPNCGARMDGGEHHAD